jgi:hypothetical protein
MEAPQHTWPFWARPAGALNDNRGERLAPASWLDALVAARNAIAKHRDGIHGEKYDYEGDPLYRIEAELYRVLPLLNSAIYKLSASNKN